LDDRLMQALQGCRLFAELSEEELKTYVLPAGDMITFNEDDVLIAPQQEVDWLSVLICGRVQILQMFSDGERSLTAAVRSSHVVGADLIYTKSRRSPYYAIASEAGQMLKLPMRFLESETVPAAVKQSIWQGMMYLLARENIRKYQRLAILSERSLRNRILVFLAIRAGKKGEDTFYIPFSRQELADYLCVNRTALSRELSRLEQEGSIRFRKNSFTVLRESGLWEEKHGENPD